MTSVLKTSLTCDIVLGPMMATSIVSATKMFFIPSKKEHTGTRHGLTNQNQSARITWRMHRQIVVAVHSVESMDSVIPIAIALVAAEIHNTWKVKRAHLLVFRS